MVAVAPVGVSRQDSMAADPQSDTAWLLEAAAQSDESSQDGGTDWLIAAAEDSAAPAADTVPSDLSFLQEAVEPAAVPAAELAADPAAGPTGDADTAPAELTELDRVRKFTNAEFLPWIGLQLPETQDGSLPRHHPMTRALEAVLRDGMEEGLIRHRTMSCKRLCTTALQHKQKIEVLKRADALLRAPGASSSAEPEPLEVSCSFILGTPEEGMPYTKDTRKGKTASINWRWDSTSMFLRLSVEQSAVRHRWCLRKMDKLKDILSQDEKDKLADMICAKRFGLVHINSMRSRFRWGLGKKDAERIVVRPNAMESGNAATH